MATDQKVLLRAGASGASTPFEADHAKRLLAYPGTQWQEVAEAATEVKEEASRAFEALPPADDTEKVSNPKPKK